MKRMALALVGSTLVALASGCCCHRSACNTCPTPGYGPYGTTVQPMSYASAPVAYSGGIAPVAYGGTGCDCQF